MLRIETGTHTAMINRIGVDASGQYLVTGSDDKTVRVWSLGKESPSNGSSSSSNNGAALLQTLRVPISEGREGQINAVALSPDGNTIACGGWTGYEWDKQNSIYLFDRRSGTMIRRIKGLPEVMYDLCFSSDGRFLAVALGGEQGIRVFRTGDYSPVVLRSIKGDTYGDITYSVDFNADGTCLVSTCDDGNLRLYRLQQSSSGSGASIFRQVARRQAPDGHQPAEARFSPDSTRIAVGYQDYTKVSVLSASALSVLYSPDTSGVNNGDLSSVCWSADGQRLYAGGKYQNKPGSNPVRQWQAGGQGTFKDINTGVTDTIMDLQSLRLSPGGGGIANNGSGNGDVVFGAADPAFGILGRSGTSVLLRSPSKADYRASSEELQRFQLAAADAATVRFAFYRDGKKSAHFAMRERKLTELTSSDIASDNVSLSSPVVRVADDDFVIAAWKGGGHATLNGQVLPLEVGEFSHCLAIAPDRQSFLLGTDWYLRSFRRNGQERWSVPAPGICWAVNINNGNGKIAVAAFSDGTIRWYRMSDGKELLALFPHADMKRWVLWTPSGYYDCSPGSEDLIGWHTNRAKDQAADFFPASSSRNRFYRPDIISRVLSTLNEQEAIRLADQARGDSNQESGSAVLP